MVFLEVMGGRTARPPSLEFPPSVSKVRFMLFDLYDCLPSPPLPCVVKTQPAIVIQGVWPVEPIPPIPVGPTYQIEEAFYIFLNSFSAFALILFKSSFMVRISFSFYLIVSLSQFIYDLNISISSSLSSSNTFF